ncbi:MAG: hypothetical protein CM1200mP18_15900 [Gammaproteobacteria bacterium]|nr:MAG: hypothetical protein CM1200mP18_15900 [Gammaproteobacteria bacterium]
MQGANIISGVTCGQTLFLFFSDECRQDHDSAAIQPQLCRTWHGTLVLKPRVDEREGVGRIRSRIGLEAEAVNFGHGDDLLR